MLMPPPSTQGDTASEASAKTLERIAGILGCSVEVFTKGADAENEVSEAAELLRLWLAIEQPDDRRKVLDLARGLAGQA